jgi:hypothetical protein
MESQTPVDASPLSAEEVTASHGIWFNKGDEDDYELDRRWPTVPRVEGLSKRIVPVTIDISLIVYVGIVVGAVLLLT